MSNVKLLNVKLLNADDGHDTFQSLGQEGGYLKLNVKHKMLKRAAT